MKKSLLLLVVLVILSGFVSPPKKQSLFNGKDLTGGRYMGLKSGTLRTVFWFVKADQTKVTVTWQLRNSIKTST